MFSPSSASSKESLSLLTATLLACLMAFPFTIPFPPASFPPSFSSPPLRGFIDLRGLGTSGLQSLSSLSYFSPSSSSSSKMKSFSSSDRDFLLHFFALAFFFSALDSLSTGARASPSATRACRHSMSSCWLCTFCSSSFTVFPTSSHPLKKEPSISSMADLVVKSSSVPCSVDSRSERTLCSTAPLVLSSNVITVSECCSSSSAKDDFALRFSSDTAFLTAAAILYSSFVRIASASHFESMTTSKTADVTNLTSGRESPCQVAPSTNAEFAVDRALCGVFPPSAPARTSSTLASSCLINTCLDTISLSNSSSSASSSPPDDSTICAFLDVASSTRAVCSSILPRIASSARAASTSRFTHADSSSFLSSVTASAPEAAALMDAALLLFLCISASLFCFLNASTAFCFNTRACLAAASFTLLNSLWSFCRSRIIFAAFFCASIFSSLRSLELSFNFRCSSALRFLSLAMSAASFAQRLSACSFILRDLACSDSFLRSSRMRCSRSPTRSRSFCLAGSSAPFFLALFRLLRPPVLVVDALCSSICARRVSLSDVRTWTSSCSRFMAPSKCEWSVSMQSLSLFICATIASFSSIVPLIVTSSFVSSSLRSSFSSSSPSPEPSTAPELPAADVGSFSSPFERRAISSAAERSPPPATTAAAVALAIAASALASLSSSLSSATSPLSFETKSCSSSSASSSKNTTPFSFADAAMRSHFSSHRSALREAVRASSVEDRTCSFICSTFEVREVHRALSWETIGSFSTLTESFSVSPSVEDASLKTTLFAAGRAAKTAPEFAIARRLVAASLSAAAILA
mmetsp:Transcript_31628/g.94616  ORF Transcript_31628/g.94616 Transcript_31628/m.94616 type:complete len:810 (+) Transcript_31628:1012-3441(+)